MVRVQETWCWIGDLKALVSDLREKLAGAWMALVLLVADAAAS